MPMAAFTRCAVSGSPLTLAPAASASAFAMAAAAPYTGPIFGQVRDQDERRSLAIPGHWSDGTVCSEGAGGVVFRFDERLDTVDRAVVYRARRSLSRGPARRQAGVQVRRPMPHQPPGAPR